MSSDIISFLVHFHKPINNQTIERFLTLYYKGKPTKKERESLSLNTLIYFTTRFHAMMLICKTDDKPCRVGMFWRALCLEAVGIIKI